MEVNGQSFGMSLLQTTERADIGHRFVFRVILANAGTVHSITVMRKPQIGRRQNKKNCRRGELRTRTQYLFCDCDCDRNNCSL
jgi:hypothetical protein